MDYPYFIVHVSIQMEESIGTRRIEVAALPNAYRCKFTAIEHALTTKTNHNNKSKFEIHVQVRADIIFPYFHKIITKPTYGKTNTRSATSKPLGRLYTKPANSESSR